MERDISRRDALKGIGGASALAVAGVGGSSLLGTAGASSNLTIGAQDPGTVTNDRGDLSRVSVNPQNFRVEWDGFDEAVGSVYLAMEARLRVDGTWQDWSPVFRTTPWLIPNDRKNGDQFVNYSKPGTAGHFEYTDLVGALERSEAVRDESEFTPVDENGGIILANEAGRPDYASYFPENEDALQNYLSSNSVGNTADQVDSSVRVNGTYGPAFGTEELDVDEDGESDANRIQVRYTVELLELSVAIFNSITGLSANPDGSLPESGTIDDLYDEQAGEWDVPQNAGWLEYVEPGDITTGYGQANQHEPPMNGTDGYPDVGTAGDGEYPATTRAFDQLQAASSHPAIKVATSSFTVNVQNQRSSSDVPSGNTGVSVSGSGQ